MVDLIIIAVLVIIVTLAVMKIVREKRNGAKCVGCPYSKGSSSCSCSSTDIDKHKH
jgi:hypothetical protein